MFEILIIVLPILMAPMALACFYIGLKVGEKTTRTKQIIKQKNKKTTLFQSVKSGTPQSENGLDIILQNIENYDGTGAYQKELIS